MTLTELSKLAHVSVSTASKAFSMSEEIPEETRDMIFNIAKEHGCFRKFFKAKYPKLTVGIACYEIRSSYVSYFVETIRCAFESINIDTYLRFITYDDELQSSSIRIFESYTNVDGVIFIGNMPQTEAKHEIPVACFNFEPSENADLSISLNYENAIEEVLQKAKAKNISEISFLGEILTSLKQRQFEEIYEKTFGKKTEYPVIKTKFRFEQGGYCGMEELLSIRKPKIVLCAYDDMAVGAMRYAHDKGLKIPDDIQIIGMDNIPKLNYLIPCLSTIGIDHNKLIKKIATTFADIITGKETENFITANMEYMEHESSKLN